MNLPKNQANADEQQWLDRLVDGELNESERRELLSRLEQQHDGWRGCALAFLEAQAWGREFRSATAAPQSPPVLPSLGNRRRTWLAGRGGTLLATAASFLIAFGLGLVWQQADSSTPGGASTNNAQLTQNVPAKPAPAGPRAARETALHPTFPESQIGTAQYGTVIVSLDGNQDGVAESVEVPVVVGGGLDESWLRKQPATLPPHVLRALERLGHRVEQSRQYYPFDLSDGRRVVVPVDQVDVHYVGERAYQ